MLLEFNQLMKAVNLQLEKEDWFAIWTKAWERSTLKQVFSQFSVQK
jgi:predicted oxidoreductase